MNINHLDDFIKENRKAFDTERPSDDLWAKIEKGLNNDRVKKQKKQQLYWGLSFAASLLLIAGLVFTKGRMGWGTKPDLAQINPIAAQKQMRFASMIEEKRDSLAIYASTNPELYQKFDSDLQKLNQNYEKLRKELPASPNQQLTVKAMVRNLEIQMHLLSQQLEIISSVTEYNHTINPDQKAI